MNRRFRLIAALGMAVVLATFTAYVALKGGDVSEPLLQASELVSHREVATSQTVQLDGIAAGPIKESGSQRLQFHVTDREGRNRTRVEYRGSVPDAFRVGRNVIIKGRLVADPDGGPQVFRAEPGSLVTKCPSKFESAKSKSKSSSSGSKA